MKDLSLYLHIPFCIKKCNYCDFLSAPCFGDQQKQYADALCQEIRKKAVLYGNRQVDTIFIGGGTPSLLSVQEISSIMKAVRYCFAVRKDAEITIEVNPGTVKEEKLKVYRELGINRLSIGLQSGDNQELKILGRIHTWETFLHTWELVRKLGFSNVNIDLMSALPNQTLESYEQTLRKVLALQPEHISAYSLIVEEGTLFYDWFGPKGDGQGKLPDEITDRLMYEMTKKLLEEHGYYRYEISNYSLKGYECKHNTGYWRRKDYAGFGLGAASLVNNVRFQNEADLKQYLEKVHLGQDTAIERQELNSREQMEEFMFLGLRMTEGISTAEFEAQFGQTLNEVYESQIRKLEKQGLLEHNEDTGCYALTQQGIDVSNQVFVEFLF